MIKINDLMHPSYKNNLPRWKMNKAFYDGSSAVKNYIEKHKREKADDYFKRQLLTPYQNHIKEMIDRMVLTMFKQGQPELILPDSLNFLIENANGKNDGFPQFLRSVAVDQLVYGCSFVGVDMPDLQDKPIITQNQLKGNEPYMVHYGPLNVPYWVYGEDGLFDELLIHSIDEKEQEVYVLWKRDIIAIFDHEGKLIKEPKDNPLGFVPFFVSTYCRGKEGVETLGYVDNLIDTAKALLNVTSMLFQIYADQTFSQLVAQGGVEEYISPDAKGKNGGNSGLALLSTASVFVYPEGMNAPQYISPDPAQATLLQEQANSLKAELYKLGHQTHLSAQAEGTDSAQTSGVARAYSFLAFNDTLGDIAATLESTGRKLVALAGKWLGFETAADDVSIRFPRDFGPSTSQEFAQLLDFNAKYIGAEELRKEAAKGLVSHVLVGMSEARKQEIFDDIDNSTALASIAPTPGGGELF